MKANHLVMALTASFGLSLPLLAAAAPNEMDLRQLLQRMEKLEAQNSQLQQQIQQLKAEQHKLDRSLQTDRISEEEPEVATRLKSLEQNVAVMKKPSKIAEALDGIKVGAALTTVVQGARGLPQDTQDSASQLNYRADITAELPLQPIGQAEQKIFAHLRFGQGLGLNNPANNLAWLANAPNAAAFRASGANPDDSVALLGEAWYQLHLPLGTARPGGTPANALEFSFGKMDLFGFFDQNQVAGDESGQFLNSVFVHNPLLDAGGQIGVDANGFPPGAVLSFVGNQNTTEPWRLSLGVFGAGARGANYQHSLSSPLIMAQAEQHVRLAGGLAGNYRIYGWQRRNTDTLDQIHTETHRGFGVSIDQHLSSDLKAFVRYGQLIKGHARFDRALSLGLAVNGDTWGRASDTLGIAGSWLKSSQQYRTLGASACIQDSNGDGACDELDDGSYRFTPGGSEQLAELYYRYHLSPQISLSPDMQWIRRAGANPDAKTVTLFGLRANIAY